MEVKKVSRKRQGGDAVLTGFKSGTPHLSLIRIS